MATETLSVKLHMDVVKTARIVAGYKGESMTDMLSEILRPILAAMEVEEVEKRAKERAAGEPPKKGGK